MKMMMEDMECAYQQLRSQQCSYSRILFNLWQARNQLKFLSTALPDLKRLINDLTVLNDNHSTHIDLDRDLAQVRSVLNYTASQALARTLRTGNTTLYHVDTSNTHLEGLLEGFTGGFSGPVDLD